MKRVVPGVLVNLPLHVRPAQRTHVPSQLALLSFLLMPLATHASNAKTLARRPRHSGGAGSLKTSRQNTTPLWMQFCKRRQKQSNKNSLPVRRSFTSGITVVTIPEHTGLRCALSPTPLRSRKRLLTCVTISNVCTHAQPICTVSFFGSRQSLNTCKKECV